jgi:hypothetical protein
LAVADTDHDIGVRAAANAPLWCEEDEDDTKVDAGGENPAAVDDDKRLAIGTSTTGSDERIFVYLLKYLVKLQQ